MLAFDLWYFGEYFMHAAFFDDSALPGYHSVLHMLLVQGPLEVLSPEPQAHGQLAVALVL